MIHNVVDEKGRLIKQAEPSKLKTLSFNKKNMLTKEYVKDKYIDVNNTFIYNENDSLIDIKFDGRFARKRYYDMLMT